MRPYDYIAARRWRIEAASIPALLDTIEPLSGHVRIGRTDLRRYGLLGVPARRVDVLIDERLDGRSLDPRDLIVAEMGTRWGKYDDAMRTRICVRVVQGHAVLRGDSVPARDLRPADIIITATDRIVRITIGDWSGEWTRLRLALDPAQDEGRIIRWHASRYYTHLSDDDVAAVASWRPTEGTSLAAANREASRVLYALSRSLGWRKLTLRERRAAGLDDDAPQWQRADEIAERVAIRRGLSPLGVGEATLSAAAGDSRHWK